jgi:hypothetical protein
MANRFEGWHAMNIETVAKTANYGAEETAMQAYFRDGEGRAHALGNRGPVRFKSDGKLHPDILDAYGGAASMSSRVKSRRICWTSWTACRPIVSQPSTPKADRR